MQKDVHFYLTYALARQIGVPARQAEAVAWADQYTDDVKEAELHGIQTQSGVLGNWKDPQIQFSVLVPYHFIPGGSDGEHPWMTTANSERARHLVEAGLAAGPLQFGIALHGLQDTFSHQGFSGWREPLNSCYAWYYVDSGLPNVGHAELLVAPDVAHYVWTDPRNGKRIDNKPRALAAAKATFDLLLRFSGNPSSPVPWSQLRPELRSLFAMTSYDERIDGLCRLSGNDKVHYKSVNRRFEGSQKADFVAAANQHLANVMESLRGLPR